MKIEINEVHLHLDGVEIVLSKLSKIVSKQGAKIMAELSEVKASIDTLNAAIADEHDQVSAKVEELTLAIDALSAKVVDLQAVIDAGGAATAADLADLKTGIDAANSLVNGILP